MGLSVSSVTDPESQSITVELKAESIKTWAGKRAFEKLKILWARRGDGGGGGVEEESGEGLRRGGGRGAQRGEKLDPWRRR